MAMVTTPSDGRAIDCTGSGNNYAEDCENARLIAAAPDLLEALKFFVAANDSGPAIEWAQRMFECDKVARAAIAKAEGK